MKNMKAIKRSVFFKMAEEEKLRFEVEGPHEVKKKGSGQDEEVPLFEERYELYQAGSTSGHTARSCITFIDIFVVPRPPVNRIGSPFAAFRLCHTGKPSNAAILYNQRCLHFPLVQ